MGKKITKDDLKQFGHELLEGLRNAIQSGQSEAATADKAEWLKSRAVRKLLDMSAGSLQNLRITGQVRYRKVLGSYYYNRSDLMGLFEDKFPTNGTR